MDDDDVSRPSLVETLRSRLTLLQCEAIERATAGDPEGAERVARMAAALGALTDRFAERTNRDDA